MSWKDCELGDVVTLKRGHDLPNGSRIEGDIPVVSSSGITGWHNEAKAEPPGVVTGRYGTIGEVFYLNRPYWPLNTALYAIDFHGNDPKFVSYFLRNQLKNYQSEKAAVPGVDRNVLHKIKVRCPDPQSQDRIVSILSAYDDLIENNRRRIVLLEQAARLLYREWFIHLRFPGHETATIIDGLPEGWEKKPIGDIWSISYGKNLPTTKISETGQFPVHGADSIIGYYDQKNVDERLCLVTCRGNGSGNVRRTFGPTFVTNNCFILRPNYRAAELHFHFATNAMNELKLQDMRTGAAQPQLTLAGIAHVLLSIPTTELLARYNGIVAPEFDLADALRRQNSQLTRARDLLLPRLMDGRIPL